MFSLYQKLTTVRDSSAHLNKQLPSRNTCSEIQRKYAGTFRNLAHTSIKPNVNGMKMKYGSE